MDATAMRGYFDILQDKTGSPWFSSDEKDEFLYSVIYDYINDFIGDGDTPPTLEKNKGATQAISTLIKSVSITTDGSGVLTNAAVNTATGGTAITPLKISRETLATGTVTLSGVAGTVTGILVNSVQIMSGTETFATTLTALATDIADNITAFSSSPNYTATSSGAVITIRAATGSGTTPNTFVVSSTGAGGISTVDVDMSGGSSTAPAPAKFVRHNDIDKFQDNTYKAGTDAAPLYTIAENGWQIYADTVATVAFSVVALIAPTAITDLPDYKHYEQVAKAMAKTGLVTEDQALTLMGSQEGK